MTSPKLADDSGANRVYWRNGVPYISVTSALHNLPGKGHILMKWTGKLVAEAGAAAVESVKECVTCEDSMSGPTSPYLYMDKAEMVEEFKDAPNRVRDAAGDKGTSVHNALERLVDGEDAEKILTTLTPEEVPYFRAATKFLADHEPEFVYQEASVFSDAHQYAGTTDAIVRMRKFIAALNALRAKDGAPPVPLDSLTVLDWKTSNGVYKEVACQMAGYRRADTLVLPSGEEIAMPETVAGAVVHLKKDGEYDLYWADTSDRVFGYFLDAMAISGWEKEVGVLSKYGKKTGRIGR